MGRFAVLVTLTWKADTLASWNSLILVSTFNQGWSIVGIKAETRIMNKINMWSTAKNQNCIFRIALKRTKFLPLNSFLEFPIAHHQINKTKPSLSSFVTAPLTKHVPNFESAIMGISGGRKLQWCWVGTWMLWAWPSTTIRNQMWGEKEGGWKDSLWVNL